MDHLLSGISENILDSLFNNHKTSVFAADRYEKVVNLLKKLEYSLNHFAMTMEWKIGKSNETKAVDLRTCYSLEMSLTFSSNHYLYDSVY